MADSRSTDRSPSVSPRVWGERGRLPFRPPTDWEAVFAADPNDYTFSREPSQIARSALHYLRAFGADPARCVALDLGSGEGRDTAFLAAAGLRVVARDLSPTGLDKTRALLAASHVPPERVDLALGDVREFDYPPQAYDLALAANVFQFLSPGEVPAHITRLQGTVRPGGLCGVGVFSPAMSAWGADLSGHFAASGDDLAALFPPDQGWLVVDKTEHAAYRVPQDFLIAFSFVVARKAPDSQP